MPSTILMRFPHEHVPDTGLRFPLPLCTLRCALPEALEIQRYLSPDLVPDQERALRGGLAPPLVARVDAGQGLHLVPELRPEGQRDEPRPVRNAHLADHALSPCPPTPPQAVGADATPYDRVASVEGPAARRVLALHLQPHDPGIGARPVEACFVPPQATETAFVQVVVVQRQHTTVVLRHVAKRLLARRARRPLLERTPVLVDLLPSIEPTHQPDPAESGGLRPRDTCRCHLCLVRQGPRLRLGFPRHKGTAARRTPRPRKGGRGPPRVKGAARRLRRSCGPLTRLPPRPRREAAEQQQLFGQLTGFAPLAHSVVGV